MKSTNGFLKPPDDVAIIVSGPGGVKIRAVEGRLALDGRNPGYIRLTYLVV